MWRLRRNCPLSTAQRHRWRSLLNRSVGDLPLSMQAKLLRALEQRQIRPVGSDHEVPIDVRVLAATNRDLSQAATPPASWYLDPAVLDREKAAIFGSTWQLAGHTDQVREPGDYFTCVVSEEPLVVARGGDGVVRAFSNVCRHRAGPVARGGGNRKSLQCGYHGWTYGMDGALLTTPEFDGVACFDKKDVRLPAVRVDTWAAFVFVIVSV
mgnify:CR=1 FL=1